MPGTLKKTLLRVARSLLTSSVVMVVFFCAVNPSINSWMDWFVSAVLMCCFSVLFIVGVNAIFEMDKMRMVVSLGLSALRRKD